MTKLGWLTFLFLASSAGMAAGGVRFFRDLGNRVREFGGTNYYLPMTDGRLVLEKQGDGYRGRFNQMTFSGGLKRMDCI